jgi:uncharacterized protein YfaQ (DUF2300 family)
MAQTQHDLNDYQHRTATLLDEVQVLKKECELNKGMRDFIATQTQELEQAKDKLSHQTKTIERLETSLKEQGAERTRILLEERRKLQESQETAKELQRQLDIASSQSQSLVRASKNSQFNAEDLLDSLQKLEKENRFLRSELDNKFDKEKYQMQAQLQDALRDKSRLEEGKQEMEERLGLL